MRIRKHACYASGMTIRSGHRCGTLVCALLIVVSRWRRMGTAIDVAVVEGDE